MGTRRFMGRKMGGISPGINYVNDTGLLYGYSFRQLKPSATFSIRQYKTTSKEVFQDVGFVNGYIDYPSVLSFANGGRTYFELYNQQTNILDFVQRNNSLPSITDNNGQLFMVNDKIYYESFQLQIINFSVTGVNIFMEAGFNRPTGTISSIAFSAMPSQVWIGYGYTGQTSSAGPGTYYKDGVLISPINRDIFMTAQYLTNNVHLLTIRGLSLTGKTELIQGYNLSTGAQFPCNLYHAELLIYNSAIQTTNEILNLEQNIMAMY